MKKLFLLLAAVLMIFTSCESNQGEARAIIGHSYLCYQDDSNWETIYFSSSGDVQISGKYNGESKVITHMTYTIRGCNVEIIADYTEYWLPSYRGQILGAMTYYPEGDYLVNSTGDIYTRTN